MSATIERLRVGRPVTWRTLVGLLLVPIVAAGVLLWGLWNPTERLDSMTAAVVNLDKPVTVEGQMVPLGRVLAAELIGAEPTPGSEGSDGAMNFTWLLTDEADADAGLDDGRYATVITIPKNFSSAATSMSRGADEAERATINVQTSDRGRLLDPALSGIVSSTATSVLNAQLGAQYVGNVFVGMTEIGKGISEAADGAEALASGGNALADGADQLASGATELASGTQQLAVGTQELSSGAAGIASGATDLASGMRLLAHGDGGENPGLAGLAAGVTEYTNGVNGAITGLQEGAGAAVQPLQQLRSAIEYDLIPLPPEADKQKTLDQLASLIGQLQGAASHDPDSKIEQLKAGGTRLAAGTSAAANGAGQLASGAEALAVGSHQLAGGAAELAAGTPSLAAGTSQLAGGVTELAGGARQASEGTASLAGGLKTAANEVPRYTKAQSERMAEVAVRPVEAEGASDELFNASGVPLFAGIALWAGSLASFLVLAPLWGRTRQAARGVGFITLRSALPALLIGAAQGTIAGILLPILLGYGFMQGLTFFGLSLLAGIAFSLINQGLSALLGGLGRFVSFALLVVAFAIGVISTAPPLLQSIGDASPIGALFSGFQSVAMGVGGVGGAAFTLVLWGLGGLVLTAFSVGRARKRPINA